jgi:ABC-type Fe3+/spermidine/putrescine transport system ATPase subunit
VAQFLGEANMFRLKRAKPVGQGQIRWLAEEGVTLLSDGSAAGTVACVRPENIAIAMSPPVRDNCFRGRIADKVQVASSIRYRVEIAPGCRVSVRVAAERRTPALAVDETVHVGWDADDMLVMPG